MSGFEERVLKMATELGLQTQKRANAVQITVSLEDKDVEVFVRPCGDLKGKEVLEFSTTGFLLPQDDASKMPLLILALQRNADVMLGHWGLDETEDGFSLLRVFHSQITETMDLPELEGAVSGVAAEYATFLHAVDAHFQAP